MEARAPQPTRLTFPPSTSSPITRHAAVWIVLAKFCSAVEDAMMLVTRRDPVNGFQVDKYVGCCATGLDR